MAIGKNREAIRELRTLLSVGSVRELSDGQLLERFATVRGDLADSTFAELIERHGSMVLRVCRSVLSDPNDAEDAFQATFLILLRKAPTLWVRDSLGPWLYQVAYRTAQHARTLSNQRRRLELAAASVPQDASVPFDPEHVRLIHEELARLPEHYRAPLVLCDLEGCTHEQAARHLGWPIGTVKSRQARGRDQLRDRLKRRGLSPTAGMLGLTHLADSAVSKSLVDSTLIAVVEAMGHKVIVSGAAASLALGVLRSMTLLKCLKLAAVAVVLGAAASSVSVLAQKGEPTNAKAASAEQNPAGHVVVPGPLIVKVTERGVVEASHVESMISKFNQNAVIKSVLPEGTRVKKGQVILEFDRAPFEKTVEFVKTKTQESREAFEEAAAVAETAELAIAEHEQGILPAERAAAEATIAELEATIAAATRRIGRAETALKLLDQLAKAEGPRMTAADVLASLTIGDRIEEGEQSIRHSKAAIDVARMKLRQSDMTGRKTLSQLGSELRRVLAIKTAKQLAWDTSKKEEASALEQVKQCTVQATIDGFLVYPTNSGLEIAPDLNVTPSQHFLSVIDLNAPMQVLALVPESMVDQVAVGSEVAVKVDAFPNASLTGKVIRVAPRPNLAVFRRERKKTYDTTILLDKPQPSLRPGMTAEVDIIIKKLDNVLSVPAVSVIQTGDRNYVEIRKPDGKVERREVELGAFDRKFVEVKQGVKSGEVVIPPRPDSGKPGPGEPSKPEKH